MHIHTHIFEFIYTHIHARIHRVPLFLSVITSLEKRHFAFQHSISSRIPSASSPITMNLSGFPIIFFFLFDEFQLSTTFAPSFFVNEMIFSWWRRGKGKEGKGKSWLARYVGKSRIYRGLVPMDDDAISIDFIDCCRPPPIMEGKWTDNE